MLQVSNVVKVFGTYRASNGVSFSVEPGRIFGLLGPNGAGKTTLIRMITNILMPDEGTITIGGEPVSAQQRGIIGYLPEERGLYKKLTVGQQLVYFAQLKGISAQEAMQRAMWWLDKMNAKGWETKKIQELSKGMQQKVQFISTLLHEPKLVILDEPFSGLDPVNAELLITVIKELQQRNATVILSTHQMEQVEKLCDDIVLINKGSVVLNGSVRNVKKQHQSNRVVLEFEGANQNFLNIQHTTVEHQTHGRIELLVHEPATTAQVLQQAVLLGGVTKIEIEEPTLHDIFIDAVQQHSTSVIEH